jgi:hypothetical protein
MSGTNWSDSVDPDKTIHGTTQPSASPAPQDATSDTDTVHDYEEHKEVSEKSPESAKFYIKQFKETLNREGEKQAPPATGAQ